MGFFIDDGLTLEAAVEARAGLHPELAVSYRPATPEAVHRLFASASKPEDTYKARVAFLLKHLVSWGADVPITEANLRRLRYQLLTDLVELVAGYSAGKGGESENEADAKNSPTGG